MKTETFPSWRDNPEIAALYRTIEIGAEAVPRLRDERDTAKRKADAAQETLDHIDLRHRAGRVGAADLKRAQARADEARNVFAKADADLEDAIRATKAAEAVLPEVIAEARRSAGAELMKLYRAKVAAIAPEMAALAAEAADLQRLAGHVEADFAGLATAGGYTRLHDFGADAPVLGPANSITHTRLCPRDVERWIACAREHGLV
jgi:hypothetical protein